MAGKLCGWRHVGQRRLRRARRAAVAVLEGPRQAVPIGGAADRWLAVVVLLPVHLANQMFVRVCKPRIIEVVEARSLCTGQVLLHAVTQELATLITLLMIGNDQKLGNGLDALVGGSKRQLRRKKGLNYS